MTDALATTLLACLVALVVTPGLIRGLGALGLQTLHRLKADRDNRAFVRLHEHKSGTPVGGGLLMIVAGTIAGALALDGWSRIVVLAAFLAFAVLGLADDVSKGLVRAGVWRDDLAALPRFAAQWLIGGAVAVALWRGLGLQSVQIPWIGGLDLGFGYVLLAAMAIVSTVNAVAVTDGLDGLAGGLLVIALGALLVVALQRGRTDLAMVCGALIGSTLGFLFFNMHPARIFMGDVGSQALGAALVVVALLLDMLVPFVLLIGVFAVEISTSLVQIVALRAGRRVFRIAPLHHHLEALGWPETQITHRFWLAGAVLAIGALLIANS
ncbi:MAG: phospho-N-acetylmuramoyl-pentapeptide-transferase [Dehalococcoidia bacterium]|nr:phospho-N-acetylmuramoyl-pentapeptide-transferase [Dehalococcoidia bacterium]